MSKRGFTLIELLVVISIIGLISSIALANLQAARASAQVAAAQLFNSSVNSSLGGDEISSLNFTSIGNVNGFGQLQITDGTGNSVFTSETQPVPVEGMNGQSLYFSGDSYIWGRNFPTLNTNSQITVSLWFKPADIASISTIFAVQSNGGQNCTGFNVGISGGRITLNGTEVSDRILVNNVYQSLVVSIYKSGSTNLVDTYVDGNKVSLVSAASGLNVGNCANGNWSVGADVTFASGGSVTGSSNYFLGQIDNLHTYSKNLILPNYSSQARNSIIPNGYQN